MHPYLLILAAACLTSAAGAGFAAARTEGRTTARLVVAIFLGTAWWSLCDVATCLVTTRDAALLWMRLSAPGWIFLGPLLLHFCAALAGGAGDRTRQLLAALYAVSVGFLVANGLGPALSAGAVPTAWGWRTIPGPAVAGFYAATLLGVLAASPLLAKRLRTAGSASERRQQPWIVLGVATPICVTSFTDGVLPLLGFSFPRLGSPSFACLGALGAWLVQRYGHSLPTSGAPVAAIRAVLPDSVALRERVVTAARMAAVGELAAGIAHEINNPIAFVRSNLSQLRGHWKTLRAELESAERNASLRELVMDGDALIEESIEGVDRAAEIVRGVRGFSHAGSGERVPTDLNRIVDEVLRMVGSRLRGRVTLECTYVDLPRVRCAPQELKQVFLNLLVNAEQAVGEGGRIRVATSRGRGCANVLVEDDGCGIAEEIQARVFDPFFTTKPVGVGTGLGLGIAYQIVKAHGGEIAIDSRPGAGTRVRVRLPSEA